MKVESAYLSLEGKIMGRATSLKIGLLPQHILQPKEQDE